MAVMLSKMNVRWIGIGAVVALGVLPSCDDDGTVSSSDGGGTSGTQDAAGGNTQGPTDGGDMDGRVGSDVRTSGVGVCGATFQYGPAPDGGADGGSDAGVGEEAPVMNCPKGV